ncbi:GCN5-related N-acetyltransferase 5, chloroplastic [Vicia villosa]|uniref:GCN5-related N-acetyltransferase 5, chloroplastic n=1 Tax=Vicia villosa TaxID=3911 RepID=UPI00273C8280|nr:GCN5-related N-acetyltransferase 5, chloroplastic [Vicia villosa]
MATTLSLSFSLDPQNRFNILTTTKTTRRFTFSSLPHRKTLIPTPNPHFKLSSSSHSQSQTLAEPIIQPGKFLTNEELDKLQFLSSFLYSHQLESGTVWVRVMRDNEVDPIVCLLADSFAESMMFPKGYINVLRFLVKQYLVERRSSMPHMATLVGFYRGVVDGEDEEMQLAGTVEISFDKNGANTTVPSPTPPRDSPYICNMAVEKSLRRRGIGWHLLQASEELISQMSSLGEVYLHCRMIDEAPFNMYTKADYKIVTTDSILVLLMLQRRKHLMCKKLPLISMPSETDVSWSDE